VDTHSAQTVIEACSSGFGPRDVFIVVDCSTAEVA
jgi:hypothetical protein